MANINLFSNISVNDSIETKENPKMSSHYFENNMKVVKPHTYIYRSTSFKVILPSVL